MSEIKRYAGRDPKFGGGMGEHHAGSYVLHIDHVATLTTERTAREAAEADRDHARARRLEAEEDLRTIERTLDDTLARAEAAEAAVARMREDTERLAARYDLIAAEHQHNADLVGEASNAYRIHLNLAGGYRERAADVRALLEGRRYSEDEHG